MTTVSTIPAAIGATDQDLPVGFEVGEYRIEALIGKGGFGTVYRAAHPLIGKLVAIKVLARKYAADEVVVARFVAEARAVNQIRHRNIIDIFLFSQLPDGRHYYVMEYLDGEPLDQFLRANGPMELASAVPILRAIAKALDAAHAKGIAHRDLKPENIYLANDPDGGVFPKLLDFGIAKLLGPEEEALHRTGTGVPIGTPYYMSPEQCRGRNVDHRTDVYSLGIVAYRVLTGTYPFEGDDYLELLFKQVNEEPPPPSSRNPALPATVDTAIAWMMRKDRDQRPPTVLEAVAALDPRIAETPSSLPRASGNLAPALPAVTPDAFAATTASTTAAPDARPKPRRTVWIGGALVVVCSAAGVMLMLARDKPTEVASSTADSSTGSGMLRDRSDPMPIAAVLPIGSAAVVVDPGTTAPAHGHAPPDIVVTFRNVPKGTIVRIAKVEYKLPTTIAIPRGAEAVAVVLDARGYEPKTLLVVPDHDVELDGTMTQRRSSRPQAKAIDDDRHGIIDLDHSQFRNQP